MADYEAKHFDGSAIIEREDGVLVLTDRVEPGEETLASDKYYYTSGPRDAVGHIVARDTGETETKPAKKAAKKTAKR